MRQARKREILNFIDGLHEAHGEIKEAMEKHDMTSAQTMLAECQEFAVDLGTAIEQTEGEGCTTVSYVEEYCETIFHVYEEVLSGGEKGIPVNIANDANEAYFAERYPKAYFVGIDLNENTFRLFDEFSGGSYQNVEFRKGDWYNLDLNLKNQFDGVMSLQCIS